MSTKTVAAILGLDIASRSPAAVLAANPTYTTLDPYMYQCLKDLLAYPDQPTLQEHIVRKYGSNLSMADSGIQLVFSSQDQALTETITNGYSDVTGGEFGILSVLVNLHDPVGDVGIDTVEQVHLRIRYILDQDIRNRTHGAIPAVNPSGGPNYLDPTVYDSSADPAYGIVLRWLKFEGIESALEMVSLYSMQYVTRFPN